MARVSRATDDDLAAIADSASHWTDDWSGRPARSVWWVLDGDADNGYAGALVEGTTLHLTRCYVAPEYRGHGCQVALIRARLRWGRACGADRAETYTAHDGVASARNLIACGFTLARAESTPLGVWLTWERAL